ncbi:HAMP domain-containing histidine kinase [Myxococcota bacterium]|nr:HAMP domain-containing histidine kinase [Myxococcota bacterium]
MRIRLDQAESDVFNAAVSGVSKDPAFLLDALRSAQREIEVLRGEVAALAERRSEWMAMLSHELRTPLSLISGYGRLMLSGEAGPTTAKQDLYLTESAKGCRRLDGLIRQMLDVVDEKSVRDNLEIALHDTEEWVSDVLVMMAPIFESSGVHVICEIEPDLPKCHLDRLRAEQVLTNLLQNALRVTKSGGTVRVQVQKVGACGHADLEISVVDEGPGVEPQCRERIFEPFVQLGPPKSQFGLGLGLAICRRIADAHGGRLGVDDVAGGGSRFFFRFPVHPGSTKME